MILLGVTEQNRGDIYLFTYESGQTAAARLVCRAGAQCVISLIPAKP